MKGRKRGPWPPYDVPEMHPRPKASRERLDRVRSGASADVARLSKDEDEALRARIGGTR